jgi:hypothetical protein
MPFPHDEEPVDPAKDLGPGFWLRARLPLETETAAFILANVLDFFVTYLLLYGGRHVESNPLARYFWEGWGIKGMVLYKLGNVALVCVIAQIVARVNLKAARRLLVGLTLVVAAVVAYSLALAFRT